jgi:glycosyltransferase involved in cell wall biosynthesis
LKDALNQNGIKNVVAIHYGIDTHDFTASSDDVSLFKDTLHLSDKKIILFGGRLSGPKGGKIMIDTLEKLVHEDSSIVLLIAGTPNEYSEYLLGYAKELGISEHVVFTGWLDRKEMKKAYAICDVVVTPSIYFDAFNLFNIEAGAAGKPVVGTCFGGTPEIVIDGETGKIVNPNNIEMMKESLLEILNNSELKKKLGDAGKGRIEKYFTLDRYVGDTLDWYQKV